MISVSMANTEYGQQGCQHSQYGQQRYQHSKSEEGGGSHLPRFGATFLETSKQQSWGGGGGSETTTSVVLEKRVDWDGLVDKVFMDERDTSKGSKS